MYLLQCKHVLHFFCYSCFMLGQAISISWTVSNVGIGITAANSWDDRIYWSEDQSFSKLLLILASGSFFCALKCALHWAFCGIL